MSLTPHEILVAAYDWLRNKEHWTTGSLLNAQGQTCAIGSIYRVAGKLDGLQFPDAAPYPDYLEEDDPVKIAARALAAQLPPAPSDQIGATIYTSNDTIPWKDNNNGDNYDAIIAAYERAIEATKPPSLADQARQTAEGFAYNAGVVAGEYPSPTLAESALMWIGAELYAARLEREQANG